jgi:hypothetical protein
MQTEARPKAGLFAFFWGTLLAVQPRRLAGYHAFGCWYLTEPAFVPILVPD